MNHDGSYDNGVSERQVSWVLFPRHSPKDTSVPLRQFRLPSRRTAVDGMPRAEYQRARCVSYYKRTPDPVRRNHFNQVGWLHLGRNGVSTNEGCKQRSEEFVAKLAVACGAANAAAGP